MARRNVLKDLENQFGNLEEVIPPLVNEGGQIHAAQKLRTTQSTISLWLKHNGYSKQEKWIKTNKGGLK